MSRTLISQAQLQRGRGKYLYWTVLVAVILVFTLVFIGPLYWMVTGALKSGQEIAQTPPTLWPQHPETQNYADAWNNLNLAKLLFNTFYYGPGRSSSSSSSTPRRRTRSPSSARSSAT